MKRIIPFLILTAAVIIACGPKEVDAEQRLKDSLYQDSLTLKIGYLPTLDALPLLVAEHEGYFDTARVKLISYNAALDLDTAILNNRVQLSMSDLCRAILLKQKDKDIVVIGRTQNSYQLITAQKQRIRKFSDMNERTVGIARHEVSDYLLDKMLKSADMSPDVVSRPQINSLPLRKQMIDYEELDAVLLPEPYATALLLAGNRLLKSSEDMDEQLGCLVINQEAQTTFLEQMKVVAKGYNKAVDFLQKNKLDLTTYYDISKEVADTLVLPAYTELSLPREKDIENSIKWLQERKLLPKKYTSTGLTEERFLN